MFTASILARLPEKIKKNTKVKSKPESTIFKESRSIKNSTSGITIKPTKKAPEVEDIGNDLMLYVTCMQEDKESGIDTVEYGYKLKDDATYTWLNSIDGLILEEGQIYEIKTRVTDRAGNKEESEVVEIQCPLQITRTVPNEPAMATGMKAIVWDGTFERPTTEMIVNHVTGTLEYDPGVEVTWYNYDVASGLNDSKKSIWANTWVRKR